MPRQTFSNIDSALDTLKYFNTDLKRNAWLERGWEDKYEVWRVVWK